MKIKLEGCITAFLLLVGPLSVGSKHTTTEYNKVSKLGEKSVRMGKKDIRDEPEEKVAPLDRMGTLGCGNEVAMLLKEMQGRVKKLEDLAKIGTLRSCAEYSKHGLKDSGLYMIDPDGTLQGQEPFQAYCDFHSGATEIFHDTESSTLVDHCHLPGCYNKSITYINGQDQSPILLSQILSLMELAEYCTQEIIVECTLAPLNDNDINNGYWFDRHGEKNIYFTGSNYGNHVCDCHYDEGGCINQKWGNRCNCDAKIPVRSSDKGTITNMTALPVSKMFFGGLNYDLQFAAFTLGRLKCYGEGDVNLATSCSALKRKGILQSGYYHIKAANDVHASLVFCDMQSPTYSDVHQQKDKQSDIDHQKIATLEKKLKQLETNLKQSVFVVRLSDTPSSTWSVGPGKVDRIEFTADKNIYVHGLSMLGSTSGTYTHSGLFKIKETSSGAIIATGPFSYTADGRNGYYNEMFSSPGSVSAGVKYTVEVEYSTSGQTIYQAKGGSSSRPAVCNGMIVNFNFYFKSSAGDNGSRVTAGQIPRIFFSC